MKNRWRPVLVLVFAVFGSNCDQAPASTKHYEVGSVYKYDYVLGLELSEPSDNNGGFNGGSSSSEDSIKSGSTVGYKIISQVEVKPVWQNEPGGSILEIHLVKPQLQIKSRKAPQPDGFRDHSSGLDDAKLHPLFVHWKDGQIQGTFSVKNDDTSLVNIKKGIANILQIRTSDTLEGVEATPAGKCNVKYNVKDAFHLSKSISGQCDSSSSNYLFRSHNNQVLGSEIESQINSSVSLTRDSGVVGEVHVSEIHVVRVNARKEVGANIQASQSFILSDTTSSSHVFDASSLDAVVRQIEKAQGVTLIHDTLESKPEKLPFCEASNCKTIDALSPSLTSSNIATAKMASTFLQMVAKFRELSANELQSIVKKDSKILPQILDVCAAVGSLQTHQVVMKVLNFHLEDDISGPERYLLGLALSPSPAPEVLQDLFKLLKRSVPSSKLQESLLLTTAAIAHSISSRNFKSNLPQSHLYMEIQDYILTALESCNGETASECRDLYIRSLKNLKSKSSLPILFSLLESSTDQRTAVVVMKSIHSMPNEFIETQHRALLIKIIQQLGRKYDSSVRTLALDIILRNAPTKEEVKSIVAFLLRYVSDKQHAEVSTFMWNRIHEFMETNSQLQSFFYDAIQEESMKTYHHLSPRGLSTTFTRYFTCNPSGNSSFSNSIEMNGKILKRSLFDVTVTSQREALQLLSLGIFADGLASFTNGDDDSAASSSTAEEEVDATAGMELTLMGVQTRPLVFFVGKGELMGLVWSGAGSERTSAIQGNVLLQDDRKFIPLFNGIMAEVNIQGGISFDLAGQVQLSLWHRTANSLVENKAGLVLQSVVRADTSFVRSRVDYTIAAEAALHFTSNINFYDGVVMCLKLTQPEFKIRQNIHKTERIPGSKHKLRKARYKTTSYPGITYALNKKNSQLCGVMNKDEL